MARKNEPASGMHPDDEEFAAPRHGRYAVVKRALDYILAPLLLVLLGPILAMAMLLVKLTSPGPALYTQVRVGRSGRTFTIYKIRTMHHLCEAKSGPSWSPPRGDTRVTGVGRWLRRTKIDELPQLWNVLRGEMSLIGPRPERPVFVEQLKQIIPRYRDRLQVLPGLTGLAQIQLPPDTDIASVRRKLACDLYYIHHLSFWLDLRILICTVSYLIGIPFSIPKNLLRVPGGFEIEANHGCLIEPVLHKQHVQPASAR
jgi:lipopolysaccharide/colanic/teichoic acid biosynthesis glycosyltransferase